MAILNSIGFSPELLAVTAEVEMVETVDSAVLIPGEMGNGKELIARAIPPAGFRRNLRWKDNSSPT